VRDDSEREHHELLGRLTEVFNDVEFVLHWAVWGALPMGSHGGAAITHRLGATDLIGLIRRLAEAGLYEADREQAEALANEASQLVEKRNRYIHSLWATATIDGTVTLVHQRLRDVIRKPYTDLTPFDAVELEPLCTRFESFFTDLVAFANRRSPPDPTVADAVTS
jgi:hypothetical protein